MMKRPRGKSADELVEQAASLMHDAQKAMVKELRYYLAEAIVKLAKSSELEQCVAEDRGDPDFEVSREFIAGMLYAAECCVGREDFDY